MFTVYVGQMINGVKVTGHAPSGKYGRGFTVTCRCGIEIIKYTAQLKRGGTSCLCPDCKAFEVHLNPNLKVNRTHGETGNYLHRTWENMRRRCRGDWNSTRWKDKGIRVCPEWDRSYEAFAAYVRAELGERPAGRYSLDRIDNGGNYEPGNIRWATDHQQMANRSKDWRWINRKKVPPADDDPVWADLVGDLPATMDHRALAAHLGVGKTKLQGILGHLGKKCIRKKRTLSDPLV